MSGGLRVLADWELTAAESATITRCWPASAVVHRGGAGLDPAARAAALAEADVLVGGIDSVDAPTLRAAPRLRLVHLLGHGVDGLARDGVAATLVARAVRVATTDAAAIGIAEFALGCLVALARRILPIHHALAARGQWAVERTGDELFGSTLCVVGLGSVGRAVVDRGRALGMEVGAVTRAPGEHAREGEGLRFLHPLDGLDAALAVADHVVVALPITTRTEGLFDAGRIAAMKRGAYLVNVGRGGLLDEDALAAALRSGALAGAAIDAWSIERAMRRPSGYPTADLAFHELNVIMTPHCAGKTRNTRARALARVGENLRRLAAGQPLLNEARLPADLDRAEEARADVPPATRVR